MDIRELEYFKIVCEQKSITKAARHLYMSQQGLRLYTRLQDLLKDYESICNEIICIEQSQNREIELISSYGIIRLVTPECLDDFRLKYPHIKLTCHEYPDREVERRWAQGHGNVAFLVGNNLVDFPDAKQMEKFEIKLLVNKAHPLAQKEEAHIEDLKNERLYLESSEFNIHELIIQKCKTAGFEPDIAFETSGFSLCHKMVRQNKGISVIVDFIFDDMYGNDLKMIPFKEEPLYWITYHVNTEGKCAQ